MWRADRAACPVCLQVVAVRPLTGRLWWHGARMVCPGSGRRP